MKNNRKGSFLLTLWWVMGCLCLGVLLCLLAPKEARISEEENRMLSGFPALTAETLKTGEFFSGIEDFLSDGFFARAKVVEASDAVLGVFDHQTEEQRQMQAEARTNELLTADADLELWEDEEEEAWIEEPEETAAPVPTSTATPNPTPLPTPTPTAEPTPAPTPTPTPAAAVTPAAVPVLTQTAQPTQTPVPTAAPTHTPVPTASPRVTATPRVIEPLEQAVYHLELIKNDGEISGMYKYPAENITTFARSLNYLKSLLPENGEVHYMQVPVAEVGRRLSIRKSQYSGWRSTMEDALQTQVETGVQIYNIPAILNDALVDKQDLYYYDDHHWTPLGAWYAVDAIMQRRGYPTIPYEEYEYVSRIMGRDKVGREDWLHMLYPLAPTHSYILKKLTQETELDFMNYRSNVYSGYINNTRTPWRKFTTGFASEKKALLIADSFGNVFLPYLLPYYGEVHMTDLRGSYFDEKEAGGTFAELLKHHGIEDIYVVLSTSNGINSKNSLQVFWNYITK